jgi:pyrroline-5-carboxylate reductase
MHTTTIAIIGAGNMGASLLGGLITNQFPAHNLWVSDTDAEKLQQLKNQFHINTTTSNLDAAHAADIVLLAVKPQILASVVQNLAKTIQKKKSFIISIAAGVREESIQHWLGGDIAIVRAMPNTPALIGCGATALYANRFVTPEQRALAESILRPISALAWIDNEKHMDAITALSGAGPAYFFLIIEVLQNAAIELGLPADTARMLTLQTAYGAARLALESDVDAVELRKRVASKGGTTEQALQVLEESNIRAIFKKALTAATHRSEEMAKLFDTKMEL